MPESLSSGGFECTLDTELWHLNVFMSPACLPIKSLNFKLQGREQRSLFEVQTNSMYKPCWALPR